MFPYTYKVVGKDRRIREGSLWAFSRGHAEKKFKTEGETVIIVYRKAIKIPMSDVSVTSRFSKTDRILFFRNLSAMISSGLSVTSSLDILREQLRGATVKKALTEMAASVDRGWPLSKALAAYPKYFPAFAIETIRLGEVTGTLTAVLDRLAEDFEKDNEISRKVTQALAYPVIVCLVMVAILALLSIFVIPKIAALFTELKAPLPLLTRVLFMAGQIIVNDPLWVILAAAVLIGAFMGLVRWKRGRYAFHYILLRLPISGRIIKEFNLVKFFRALSTLVSGGISWVEGVEVAKKTLDNELYKKAIGTVHPVLVHGGTLSSALEPFPDLFPLQSRKMLSVGEQTGRFDESLGNITRYYERSLDHTTRIMTALLEPLLMLAIGFVVGGLALSIFVPIYQISNAL